MSINYRDILKACPKPYGGKSKQARIKKQLPPDKPAERAQAVIVDWDDLHWPTDPQEAEKLRGTLDRDFLQRFRESLPEDLRAYYDTWPGVNAEVDELFDKFLITQAQFYGAPLMLTNRVAVQLAWWSRRARGKQGIQKIGNFFEGILKEVKLRRNVPNTRLDILPEMNRLTHHVHILEMNGESCRLKESKRSRPAKPVSRSQIQN
ncbi:MAG: hypothetical protein HYX72_05295 [Acidobacteria bacterium]|nr:hypothetical protein [Acidobacteriota bacterium]